MDIFLALYSLGGLLLAGLSVPLVLHRVPPNRLFGVRLPSMNGNPELWYQANAYIGRRFIVVGLGTAVGAILLYFSIQSNVEAYALGCLGIFLALLLWGAITSSLYLKSVR